MESDNSESNDNDHYQKSQNKVGVKSSKGSQSSDMELKTIQMDCSLLMPERVESGQVEFDECYLAKLSGAIDIQQSSVRSDPNTMKNFGAGQVSTQWSEYVKNVQD